MVRAVEHECPPFPDLPGPFPANAPAFAFGRAGRTFKSPFAYSAPSAASSVKR